MEGGKGGGMGGVGCGWGRVGGRKEGGGGCEVRGRVGDEGVGGGWEEERSCGGMGK